MRFVTATKQIIVILENGFLWTFLHLLETLRYFQRDRTKFCISWECVWYTIFAGFRRLLSSSYSIRFEKNDLLACIVTVNSTCILSHISRCICELLWKPSMHFPVPLNSDSQRNSCYRLHQSQAFFKSLTPLRASTQSHCIGGDMDDPMRDRGGRSKYRSANVRQGELNTESRDKSPTDVRGYKGSSRSRARHQPTPFTWRAGIGEDMCEWCK